MKIIFGTAAFALLFLLSASRFAYADNEIGVDVGQSQSSSIGNQSTTVDSNTEIGNEVYQGQQMTGGQQYMIFESSPAKIPRQFINPYADADLLHPPLPLYLKDWFPWLGASVIPADKLYPLDRALCLVGHFQWSGLARYPANADPVHILPAKPRGPGDTPLFVVEIDGPKRGLLEETIKRALSLGKGYSGARRAYVEYKTILNPRSSGIAVGGGISNSNILSENSALAFSAVPMLGWSQTEVYDWHKVKVHFYNDGPVPLPPQTAHKTVRRDESLPQQPSGEKLPLIFFDFDRHDIRPDQKQKLDLYARWIVENWNRITASGHFILFIGGCDIRGPEGYNDTLGMMRSKAIMLAVGSILFNRGWPEDRLEQYLRYVSAGKRQPQFSENRKNRHVAMVEAGKISKNDG